MHRIGEDSDMIFLKTFKFGIICAHGGGCPLNYMVGGATLHG